MKVLLAFALAAISTAASAQTTTCNTYGNQTTCNTQPQNGINWNLAQPQPNIAGNAINAFQQGQMMAQQRELARQQQALVAQQREALSQQQAAARPGPNQVQVGRIGELVKEGRCKDAAALAGAYRQPILIEFAATACPVP